MANVADGFYCLLRYADVLLIYAEAANKADGSPSKKAYDAINAVRERAGLEGLAGLSKLLTKLFLMNATGNWLLSATGGLICVAVIL